MGWMSTNLTKLNKEKTQMILLGARHQQRSEEGETPDKGWDFRC